MTMTSTQALRGDNKLRCILATIWLAATYTCVGQSVSSNANPASHFDSIKRAYNANLAASLFYNGPENALDNLNNYEIKSKYLHGRRLFTTPISLDELQSEIEGTIGSNYVDYRTDRNSFKRIDGRDLFR